MSAVPSIGCDQGVRGGYLRGSRVTTRCAEAVRQPQRASGEQVTRGAHANVVEAIRVKLARNQFAAGNRRRCRHFPPCYHPPFVAHRSERTAIVVRWLAARASFRSTP